MIHRHFNADGELVGTTEIESPWTDETRAEAEALWELDLLICPKCGNLREVCSDPDALWYPQRSVCHASKNGEAANRRYDEARKDAAYHGGTFRNWTAKPTTRSPFHYRDGVTIWVSPVDLTPDDNFM